jgi:hypothetical protein
MWETQNSKSLVRTNVNNRRLSQPLLAPSSVSYQVTGPVQNAMVAGGVTRKEAPLSYEINSTGALPLPGFYGKTE